MNEKKKPHTELQVLSAFRILHACYEGEGNANYNEQIKRIEKKNAGESAM